MKKISKAFVEGEIINLRKGMFGYRVIEPIKNDDGTTNWMNFLIGGWGNFFKLIFILFILGCFLFGAKQIMSGCNDMADNPCKYTNLDCSTISGDTPNLNFPNSLINNSNLKGG